MGTTATKTALPGSSPLARGARGTIFRVNIPVRLIPAGAGSTFSTAWQWLKDTAHPRWRGEHSKSVGNETENGGSSPLARGAPPYRMYLVSLVRLIPAGAGST